jgi:hypothetical protein
MAGFMEFLCLVTTLITVWSQVSGKGGLAVPIREQLAPPVGPPKMSRKRKVDTDAASMAAAPANSIRTPLRIPYGNKEVDLKLGARYGSGGWYAPPGVDLSAFSQRGWL